MVTDLPDYEKKIIIVTPPGEYPAVVQVDLRKILGEDFITPTIAGCVPTSIENEAIAYDEANDWFKTYIENDAIAYDDVNDRFKVDIEAMSLEALTVIQPDASLLKATVTQAAKDRTVTGTVTAEQSDASKLKATVSATDLDIRNLTSDDVVDVSSRGARQLGIVYGDQGQLKQDSVSMRLQVDNYGSQVQKLIQRASTYELLVQLRSGGAEIDPTQIRALTSADIVTVQGITDALPAGTNTIGNVKTLHDLKTYKTAVFDASASGNLVAAVAGEVIKLHALTIQAQNTVVVNLNNGAAGASLMEWSFQAREGAVVPMANAPAYWAITSVNTALYVTLSAAVVVTITAIYSDDDAS
jgi:hypothetical protein